MSATSAAPTQAAALPLHDIHLPPAPGWWPPAPGWWLLAALIVVAILVFVRITRRRLRARRWHARVRGELDRIAASHAAQADPVRVAADVSRLLRRASLTIAPNAAALHGDAWLDFLDAQFPPDEAQRAPFRGGRAGRALLDLQYRRDDAAAADDAKMLLELARRWLDHALKAGPMHV